MTATTITRAFGTKSELSLILFMVMILLVLFSTIPPIVLDFLLIVNFTIGMMILLLTFYMDKPIGFSTFPAVLLIATLFRLSLNIASTRLILGDADAGQVIAAIGSYVVGGNYVIGLVVFLILIVVQYVVVTSGAQRVAEVAARFTLDSMPGKQMSIDADLNMGLIDEKEAQQRRADIEREANFYGSMDGASKFVKGDAIAGIIIIIIDIVGGLSVGVAQRGLSWGDAVQTYTLLTVGGGIVTQIPALIISTATGIIVTRAASDAFFGEELAKQIGRYPKTLVMAAIFLLAFMWLPGIPMLPIVCVLLVVLTIGGFTLFGKRKPEESNTQHESGDQDAEGGLYDDISVEPIEIVVGHRLVALLGDERGVFMEKIKAFRKQCAMENGFVFPTVRLRDSKKMSSNRYEISIYGSRVAQGELYPNHLLAISVSNQESKLEGIPTKDPTYGLPAIWVVEEEESNAREQGFTLVDPMTVIVTHFGEVVRSHSQELLTRRETEEMLSRVKQSHASLYEELVPNIMRLSDIQKVLQNLLSERVSVRNILAIVEILVDKGKTTQSHEELTEAVRQKLGRSICEPLLDKEEVLHVVTFEPQLEQAIQQGLKVSDTGMSLVLDPSTTEKMLISLGHETERMMSESMRPVLLCSPTLRRHVRRLVSRSLPYLTVLSLSEVPETIQVKSYSIVRVKRSGEETGLRLGSINVSESREEVL